MSPLTAFVPAAAAAATSLARSAAHGIAEGISFAAELARAHRDVPAGDPSGPSLPPDLQRAIDEFAERIRQRLAAAGIELAPPITLTGDGLGGLSIDGPPQIESLLAGDGQLAAMFHELASRYERAMGSGDRLAGLTWDTSSAGRNAAIEVAAESARMELR